MSEDKTDFQKNVDSVRADCGLVKNRQSVLSHLATQGKSQPLHAIARNVFTDIPFRIFAKRDAGKFASCPTS